MLDLTARRQRWTGPGSYGVDLFLSLPHVDIDSTQDDLTRLAGRIASRNLVRRFAVAPVWPRLRRAPRMGSEQERQELSHPGPQGLRHRKFSATSESELTEVVRIAPATSF